MARIRLALAVIALGLGGIPAGAAAATIKVTTKQDVIGNDGHCSLREAINAANKDHVPGHVRGECRAGHGADTVVVPKGTYKLFIPGAHENGNASGDLDVRGRVVIRGAGATRTTVNAAGIDRAFEIGAGAVVTIKAMTITGGHAPDGAPGRAAAPGANGSGSSAGGASDGALGNRGESGGGIRSLGTLTVIDAVITGNRAGTGGRGGNAAGGGDGGAGAGGGESRAGPGGIGGDGGGIVAPSGLVTLIRTRISGNSAGDGGAGGNAGAGGPGGFGPTPGGNGGDGGASIGGIGSFGGFGGGVYSDGAVTLIRSTIVGNRAGAGGHGGDAGAAGAGGKGAVYSAGTGGHGGAGGTSQGGIGGGAGLSGGVFAFKGVTARDAMIDGNAGGRGGDGGRAGSGGQGGLGGRGGVGGGGGAGGASTGGPGGDGGGSGGAGGVLTLTRTTVAGNRVGTSGNGGSAGDGGGGGGGGQGNSAIGQGGGAGGRGGDSSGGQGAAGQVGGGASVDKGPIVNATVSGNKAGAGGRGGRAAAGGAGGHGGGNMDTGLAGVGGAGGASAGGQGGGGGIAGGLIANAAGSLLIADSTIASNGLGGAAEGGAAGTGGTGGPGGTNSNALDPGDGAKGVATAGAAGPEGVGGGILGTVTLTDSVLALNSPSNCAGTFTDGGHNIDFPNSPCPGLNADPRLGPLKDNGGFAFTRALGRGSAARDLVPAAGAGCRPTDERGVRRPEGPRCDAGAFEFALPVIAIRSPRNGAHYRVGKHVKAHFTCSEGGIRSSIRSCKARVRSGHRINTSTAGAKTFSVTAIDKSGVRITRTVRYHVTGP